MDKKNYSIQQQLDARGLLCPEPVMLLHRAVREVEIGDVIQVLATDPSTERDIPKFCEFLGHQLVDYIKEGGQYTYAIKKGG